VRPHRERTPMDDKLISVFVGIVAGAVGYWVTTFWMKPILRYRELRSKVLSDLIYFAQVINADGLNERMQKLYEERIEANRRSSAELTACLLELPRWYKALLRCRGYNPEAAAQDLIGFSNTTDYDAAAKRVGRIKAALGIQTTLV
ncbi:MAG TPA: hypothetical protein PLD41_16455, partial [Casimicrobium huifangae]|nr:hypothetical protein [Casimicrobium huifangae]